MILRNEHSRPTQSYELGFSASLSTATATTLQAPPPRNIIAYLQESRQYETVGGTYITITQIFHPDPTLMKFSFAN